MTKIQITTWLESQVQARARLVLDSRDIHTGDVFIACMGTQVDGRQFIKQAVAKGAAAILYEIDAAEKAEMTRIVSPVSCDCVEISEHNRSLFKFIPEDSTIPLLAVFKLRKQLGNLADQWYDRPSSHMQIIAITGTNGKTSCANWIAQVLNNNKIPCAVIGTLGLSLPENCYNAEQLDSMGFGSGLTTPDVLTLQRMLAFLRTQKIQAVVMEASSIGLIQGRMDGLQIKIAAFSNLTLDHLDYHHTMQAYEAAKGILFQWLGLQTAIINQDDPVGRRFLQQTTALEKVSFTLNPQAYQPSPLGPADNALAVGVENATIGKDQCKHIWAETISYKPQGFAFDLVTPQGREHISSQLVGEHNISNLLLVSGVLQAMGLELSAISQSLAQLRPVAGRLQIVPAIQSYHAPVYSNQHNSSTKNNHSNAGTINALRPLVVVDYAHTPDALERALRALRPSAQARQGQLICVFGCGGDRDKSKRPIMGKIACALADKTYVTSDNPRTEEPLVILREIEQGMTAFTQVEADRALSILQAVLRAQPQDVILIAGKGHEAYQDNQGHKSAFDDREWSRLALLMRGQISVCTDTRQLQAGDLFVALKGVNFDAHEFLCQVQEKQAVASVVSQKNNDLNIEQILVADTAKALETMAKAWRSLFDIPVIAVTGSNGKTTTKEMIATILRCYNGAGRSLATRGNFNNQIGVPLSLLKLRAHHTMAVFELGMNHPGEIALLADMARPTIALVSNAQREHQEFMHTVEAVARENAAVFDYLSKGGIAVFPASDQFTPLWSQLAHPHQVHTFAIVSDNRRDELRGTHAVSNTGPLDKAESSTQIKPTVYATDILMQVNGVHFQLHYADDVVPVELDIQGLHNVHNALAAATCTLTAGVPLEYVSQGLRQFSPVNGRMQLYQLANDIVLIDDSYNANPDSVRAAIDALEQMQKPSVLVLGDMGEVGDNGPQMHREVAAYAKEKGISVLLCLGQATQESVQVFGQHAEHFVSAKDLVSALNKLNAKSILVKGSRYMHMESVVEQLLIVKKSEGNHDAV